MLKSYGDLRRAEYRIQIAASKALLGKDPMSLRLDTEIKSDRTNRSCEDVSRETAGLFWRCFT